MGDHLHSRCLAIAAGYLRCEPDGYGRALIRLDARESYSDIIRALESSEVTRGLNLWRVANRIAVQALERIAAACNQPVFFDYKELGWCVATKFSEAEALARIESLSKDTNGQ